MDLLERPLFAHLATSREDGWPQVNPMWFAWDGTYLKLTGTTIRARPRWCPARAATRACCSPVRPQASNRAARVAEVMSRRYV
jgi:hypothetical protein